jgi:hypothetical protein
MSNTNQAQHSERAHADISPSQLKNFDACPGFLPDRGRSTHPVTLEGTRLHEAMDDGSWVNLPDDLRELCQACAVYLEMLPTSQGQIFIEPKLDVTAGVFGFADRLQVLGKVADLIDFKFGYNEVEDAWTNLQGWAYALGAFHAHPQLEEVTVHFVQPRVNYATAHTFIKAEVPVMDTRIRGIVARVTNAKPEEYSPVPEVCQYCSRHDCPVIAEKADTIAREYAKARDLRMATEAKLLGEKEPTPTPLPDPIYPRQMDDPAELAKALVLAPILERWVVSVKKRALEYRIEQGVEIPGYELAYRAGRKTITNGLAAWEVVKERLDFEEFAAACSPSLPSLREAYTAKSKPRQKAKDVRELEAALEDLDALSSGGDSPYLKKQKQ